MTRAVARLLGGHRTDRQFRPAEPILVVIGSRDPVTSRQVDALCEQGRFERRKAPGGQVDILAGLPPRLVLQCTGDQMESGEVVAERFAAGAAAVMRNNGPRSLLVSGGDTVSAVLRALGIERIEVCGETAPGLPWFMIPLQNESTPVISKSGGFGDPGTLLKIFPAPPAAGIERMNFHGSH
jgi:D-threonate/D-erythronate kinase